MKLPTEELVICVVGLALVWLALRKLASWLDSKF